MSSKDGLIRRLLQTAQPVHPPNWQISSDAALVSAIKEKLAHLVQLEHSYARPWSHKAASEEPLSSPSPLTLYRRRLQPTKRVFFPEPAKSGNNNKKESKSEVVDVLKVEEEAKSKVSIKDEEKKEGVDWSRGMSECERFALFANPKAKALEEDPNWEESIITEGWTPAQHRVYSRTMKLLHCDQLARLALNSGELKSEEGKKEEAVRRRLRCDQSAKRMRSILASVQWDSKMTLWLHNLLCDHLPLEYLASYLDVLQTLRSKAPSLVDKMVRSRLDAQPSSNNYATREGLRILMKRRWEPRQFSSEQFEKLSKNCVFVLTPCGGNESNDEWRKCKDNERLGRWKAFFSQLGKVVYVKFPNNTPDQQHLQVEDSVFFEEARPINLSQHIQALITAVQNAINEAKTLTTESVATTGTPTSSTSTTSSSNDSTVNIFLVGWNSASAVNLQVAKDEPELAGCICLGFSLLTLSGVRGLADDHLLTIKTPVVFVQGELDTEARASDMEELRERMVCESSLIVVSGADHHLRLSKRKKRQLKLTTMLADEIIMKELRESLHNVLHKPLLFPVNMNRSPLKSTAFSSVDRQSSYGSPTKKSDNRARKRANQSNTLHEGGGQNAKPPKRSRKKVNKSSTAVPTNTPFGTASTSAIVNSIANSNVALLSKEEAEKAKHLLSTVVLDSTVKNHQPLATPRALLKQSPLLSSALTSPPSKTVRPPLMAPSTSPPAQFFLPQSPIALPTVPASLSDLRTQSQSAVRIPFATGTSTKKKRTTKKNGEAKKTKKNGTAKKTDSEPTTTTASSPTSNNLFIVAVQSGNSLTPIDPQQLVSSGSDFKKGNQVVTLLAAESGKQEHKKDDASTGDQGSSECKESTNTTSVTTTTSPASSSILSSISAATTHLPPTTIISKAKPTKQQEVSVTSSSSEQPCPTPTTSTSSLSDKKNVAEILASLSGLVPQPQENEPEKPQETNEDGEEVSSKEVNKEEQKGVENGKELK